ncbi:MAG: hypothetical protein IKW32_06125 [Bacteroidaceae bacterium]|nr:hypothetical protein [Bacteroidaceae bacterium]
MKDERMFLNQERVVDFLNVCIRSGKAAEAPGLLMSCIGEELAGVCHRYYQSEQRPAESVLARYANLSPTDGQLRRALQRLLAEPAPEGTRPTLFHSPRHWLSVYKALHFLHMIDDEYGCMARMAQRIAKLYGDGSPAVPCRRDDLAKKNIDKPFCLPLTAWEQKHASPGLSAYWQIALLFLQFLHEECVSKCVCSAEHPQ